MRWRWLAGGLWAALGALTIFRTVTSEFPSPGDYVISAILVALGIVIAMGRGPAGFLAFLGTLLAGLLTVFVAVANVSPCTFICPPAWFVVPGMAITLASALAAREIVRSGRSAAC